MAEAQTQESWGERWSQLVAKVWGDDSLKQRLLADPTTVLAEYGLEPPPGIQVKIVEDTPTVVYLSLPSKPAKPTGDLFEEDIARVARGARTIGGDLWGGLDVKMRPPLRPR
jgi:Nitrile hydratase, alpha chain